MKKTTIMKKRQAANPLDAVDYSGDLRGDIASELTVMQESYRARNAGGHDRKRRATDSEFWIGVCFESREQKEQFLAAVGLRPKLNGDKYVDGRIMAAKLGITLSDE